MCLACSENVLIVIILFVILPKFDLFLLSSIVMLIIAMQLLVRRVVFHV